MCSAVPTASPPDVRRGLRPAVKPLFYFLGASPLPLDQHLVTLDHQSRNPSPRILTFHPGAAATAHLRQRHPSCQIDCASELRRFVTTPKPASVRLNFLPGCARARDNRNPSRQSLGYHQTKVLFE